jgi:hypothetical protein
MRIISFTKQWGKLRQEQFTTFRLPRKDSDKGRDWRQGEIVQVYYHSRCPDRKHLGNAVIVSKTPVWVASIDDEQAVADGFPGGQAEMLEWLEHAHPGRLEPNTLINKLTLKWVNVLCEVSN